MAADLVGLPRIMAYTVLARKYRSQTFDDVIGQDAIAQTLKNAIETDKVHHAYLFTGTRGVGKTTVARILAKSLNCLKSDGPTTQPCCKCDSCIAVNAGEDIDVIEIDGASNTGVDNVRALRENAIYRPARARFKIYIIDEVHMLSTGAFNALLKTLEEPPSHVKFIFATTEPNKVLPTIQSRCQRFDFANISVPVIAEQLEAVLKKEKIKADKDVFLPLAKMANGSMRDGLSLLDRLISTGIEPLSAEMLEKFLGCPSGEKVHALIGKIGDADAAGTLEALDDLLAAGLNEAAVVTALIEAMRDLMVAKSAGADSKVLALTAEQQKRTTELAARFDVAALVYAITVLEKLQWTVKNSDTPRALLEAALLRFALAEHFLNVDDLLAQAGGSPAPAHKKKPDTLSPAQRSTGFQPLQAGQAVTTEADGQACPQPSERDAHVAGRPPHAPIPKPSAPPDSPLFKTEPQSPGDSTDEDAGRLAQGRGGMPDWPGILDLIGSRLGPSTRGMVECATPHFSNGQLTLRFAPASRMQMEMCRNNGRSSQIEALLAEHFATPVILKFELAAAAAEPQDAPPPHRMTSEMKKELLNHPAVKTVLMELDATVAEITEQ